MANATLKRRTMEYVKEANLKENFAKAGRVIWKLIKLFSIVISSCIALYAIGQLVPELPEKMPAFYKLVEVIIEGFDHWLMNTSFMARWF